MTEQENIYYCVGIDAGQHRMYYQVYAHSDFDAAIKVRNTTGFMPRSEKDVTILHPFHQPSFHGPDVLLMTS
jgi:hypothetical protein